MRNPSGIPEFYSGSIKEKPTDSAIRTYTGILFDFARPDYQNINLVDVSHSLSLLCRFAGHCKKFYCVTPNTRVLTSDLRWVPAGKLKVGNTLFGFDEENGKGSKNPRINRRRLGPATVLHTGDVKRPVYTLQLSDGTCLSASADHPWLMATKKSRNQKWKTTEQIYKDLKEGFLKHPKASQYMLRFLQPWEPDNSYEAGYISGIFDGEGYVSLHGGRNLSLGFAQNPGGVLDRSQKFLKDNRFKFSAGKSTSSKVVHNIVQGGWTENLRLLGSVRPMRLVDKFEKNFLEGNYNRQFPSIDLVKIVDAVFEGEQSVVALETSTHTYFAEGFGAHNSVAEHAVRVSYTCPPEHALWGLHHDDSECYCVDVPRPLKHMEGMENYRAHEKRVQAEIVKTLDLYPPDEPMAVKDADMVLLVTEQRDMLHNAIPDFYIPPLKNKIKPWPSWLAARLYQLRHAQLMGWKLRWHDKIILWWLKRTLI